MSNLVKFPHKGKTLPPPSEEERIERIRNSLEKINRLMAELKQMGANSNGN